MLYRMEVTSIKKVNRNRKDVAEMKMLRWMSGEMRRDMICNIQITEIVKVAKVSKKVQEAGLR